MAMQLKTVSVFHEMARMIFGILMFLVLILSQKLGREGKIGYLKSHGKFIHFVWDMKVYSQSGLYFTCVNLESWHDGDKKNFSIINTLFKTAVVSAENNKTTTDNKHLHNHIKWLLKTYLAISCNATDLRRLHYLALLSVIIVLFVWWESRATKHHLRGAKYMFPAVTSETHSSSPRFQKDHTRPTATYRVGK